MKAEERKWFLEVATDVGGTFTDIVCCWSGDEGYRLTFGKVHTTPPDFDQGVLQALSKLNVRNPNISLFIHGSTVVINALTERRGVPVGFITTRGFRDVLLIGRGNRPDLYNIQYRKPEPFLERHQCAEFSERMSYEGAVLTPPDMAEVEAIVDQFRRQGIRAIGLCFLHAYANPAHEIAVADAIRALWPEVHLVASHEICQEWREFERSNTTVLSAYVKPVVDDYLRRLEGALSGEGFDGRAYLMQSNGGLASFEAGRHNPITLVESGPAAGMFGAMAWGRVIGQKNLLALDIGGTTAKCTLIEDGRVRLVTDYQIERTKVSPGHPIKTPVVDIVEIGTGGGSIASVDAGGRLQVGPRSAGAIPGPIAYGKGGTEVTTTDANLWTGRISPKRFAGGESPPDLEVLGNAFAALGVRLQVDKESAARGILQVANANMVNALKLVSVNKGRDPQDFVLIAFGGGGPLHAAFLAVELRMRTVIIPPQPAVFSAWGMLLSDVRQDYFKTVVLPLADDSLPDLLSSFAELENKAKAELASEMGKDSRLLLERSIEMRYRGQEHSLRVRCTEDDLRSFEACARLAQRFHAAHEREFTFQLDAPAVVVGIHLEASIPAKRHATDIRLETADTLETALIEQRLVDFDVFGRQIAAVYDRTLVPVGQVIAGPALIEEENTVTVLPSGFSAVVDQYGNIIVTCPSMTEA